MSSRKVTDVLLNTDIALKLKNEAVSHAQLKQLFGAKCADLRINATSKQLVRFVEIFDSKNQKDARRLSFSDMGLGDWALEVVCQVVREVQPWSLDLSKNLFSESGLKTLSSELANSHSVAHVNLSGN